MRQLAPSWHAGTLSPYPSTSANHGLDKAAKDLDKQECWWQVDEMGGVEPESCVVD